MGLFGLGGKSLGGIVAGRFHGNAHLPHDLPDLKKYVKEHEKEHGPISAVHVIAPGAQHPMRRVSDPKVLELLLQEHGHLLEVPAYPIRGGAFALYVKQEGHVPQLRDFFDKHLPVGRK